MEDVFDIVIVGAGTGGAVSAITAAKSGLNVCLIDRKQKEKIGDKVCGDIIWKDYFDILRKRIGIDHPVGDELNQKVSGIKIFAPDNKTSIKFGSDHYMINRSMFGQRIVDNAINAGATLLDGLRVIAPIINDNTFVGVIAKDLSNDKIVEVRGKITIDASGAMPALRDKVILENSFLERNVSKDDMAVAYREIRSLKRNMGDDGFAKIYLSNKHIPGGYIWYFPDGEHKVNVGIGTRMSLKNVHIRRIFDEYITKDKIFSGSSIIAKGGGILPTRRPLCSLVANGFMCVGDAGCQVNPISGAGIEFSMNGGYHAANTAMDAISCGDVTQEGLWSYNQKYMNDNGSAQITLDIFKILLQSISDSDLNFGLKHLITEESVLSINSGKDVYITPAEKSKILLKGIGKLKFINKFKSVLENMQGAKELCKVYPQPCEFREWEKELNAIYSDTRRLMKH